MNVLMIGGTRDFGKISVRLLLERGDNVTVYSRGNVRPEFWDEVDHIVGDRTDHDQFVENLKGRHFDAVIDNVAYFVEDVKAAEKALKGRTGKYIVSTTVSIYGAPGHALHWRTVGKGPGPRSEDEFVDLDANVPIREESVDLSTVSWEFDPGRDAYAEGKRQMERYLSETSDFPWVVFRIPSVLSGDEPGNRYWWYLQRVLDGREMILRDGGSNVFRPGFRDDIGQAFLDAIQIPETSGEIYNVTGGDIVTLRRFLEVMAKAAGRELNTVSIPGDVAERASDLPWEDWYYDFFSRPQVYVPSIEKARLHFGLKTTPFEEWMGESVAWYMEHPDVPDSPHYDRRDDEVALCKRWQEQYGRFVESFTS